MKHFLQLATGLLMLVSWPGFAAGDAAAGQGKSALCAACHGADGNSTMPNWPKLAGQHATYLERQLGLIRDGARAVPEMVGIVANLNDQDIADLAAYFSSQVRQSGVTDEALKTAGERIYRAGNRATNVPACMACHGPAGTGNPLAGYPALAGQHATYTASMLTKFHSGQTWGKDDDNSQIMADVTLRMTRQEIKAVASYIQGLHAVELQAE